MHSTTDDRDQLVAEKNVKMNMRVEGELEGRRGARYM